MIKKLCLVIFMVMTSTVVLAGFDGPGGEAPIHTVLEAEKAKDGQQIVLEGYLVKQLEDEHYLFKDASGEIEVEIDDDVFQDRNVNPTTKIRIQGELENSFFTGQSIEVDIMEIIN